MNALATAACLLAATAAAAPPPPRTMSDLLTASTPADWRVIDPEVTLYVELPQGRVIIELAPAFAPRHVANIKALARARYYDGLPIGRVQDNFVVQWGGPPDGRVLGSAVATLPPEFTTTVTPQLPFVRLPDADGYSALVGFTTGFPVARDAAQRDTWLAHCYAMMGVGRDNAPDSGGGTELYVVIGHAPRQLDRNITLAGRVVRGMEWLAALPRGTGPLGFLEPPAQGVEIRSIRVASDLPAAERTPLEALRTDTALFRQLIELRRNRRDDWYLVPAGYIDLCNVPLPVRLSPPPIDPPTRVP